ncbi:hypothetical protein F4778DRAFT_776176 [Xylariomycetidae sp. FL2044]|nr:hypothetical protein F4778DRAFT_776176 [Xylariomycetidae sp. FL2044]
MAGTWEIKSLALIDDAPATYLHSVFSTTNYLIPIVWQCDFMEESKTLIQRVGPWDEERKSFYVIDKNSRGVVAKFEEPEAGGIIIDLPTLPNTDGLYDISLHQICARLGSSDVEISFQHDNPARYRLPKRSGSGASPCGGGSSIARSTNVTTTTLIVHRESQQPFSVPHLELPRINEVETITNIVTHSASRPLYQGLSSSYITGFVGDLNEKPAPRHPQVLYLCNSPHY